MTAMIWILSVVLSVLKEMWSTFSRLTRTVKLQDRVFGDEVDRIMEIDTVTGEIKAS